VIRSIARLTLTWVLLFALAGAEFVVSSLKIPTADRPLLLVFAVVMVVVVVTAFMRGHRAPIIARGFAVAAVFWLIVLLGLGTMDVVTRHTWWVHGYTPQ
jgi:hypothetical protein